MKNNVSKMWVWKLERGSEEESQGVDKQNKLRVVKEIAENQCEKFSENKLFQKEAQKERKGVQYVSVRMRTEGGGH